MAWSQKWGEVWKTLCSWRDGYTKWQQQLKCSDNSQESWAALPGACFCTYSFSSEVIFISYPEGILLFVFIFYIYTPTLCYIPPAAVNHTFWASDQTSDVEIGHLDELRERSSGISGFISHLHLYWTDWSHPFEHGHNIKLFFQN